MLGALRDDALESTDSGFVLRLALPWIRSLPLWSLVDLEITIDGRTEQELEVVLDDRAIPISELASEPGWWFVQDRLVIRADRTLDPGEHDVSVSFRLAVPYLQAGPDGPLQLPFRFHRTLTLDRDPAVSTVSHDVA